MTHSSNDFNQDRASSTSGELRSDARIDRMLREANETIEPPVNLRQRLAQRLAAEESNPLVYRAASSSLSAPWQRYAAAVAAVLALTWFAVSPLRTQPSLPVQHDFTGQSELQPGAQAGASIQFAAGSSFVAVTRESQRDNVTIAWLYPRIRPQTEGERDEESGPSDRPSTSISNDTGDHTS